MSEQPTHGTRCACPQCWPVGAAPCPQAVEIERLNAETERLRAKIVIAHTTLSLRRAHIAATHDVLRQCRRVLAEQWAKAEARQRVVKSINAALGERDE